MAKRLPLSATEQAVIYQGKQSGETLATLARRLGCTSSTARKWWRHARDHGGASAAMRRRGRPATGCLSTFAADLCTAAVAYKRSHPRWGAVRVLVELRTQPAWAHLRLPSASGLAGYFKLHCPECVHRPARKKPMPRPCRPQAVHEQWQLDSQEGLRLSDGQIATVCNVRDPVGGAMLASRVFAVQTPRHWRKLTWTEVRAVLRHAFTEWQTLPDSVQTDNELGLAGTPTDSLPGRLTLWLVGLGIHHTLIRPGHPRDQAEIERQHRTLDGFVLDATSLANLVQLQTRFDAERWLYNRSYPTRASDCAQRPPLVAHPELRQPRRPYAPHLEAHLFDLQRVYDYLATFRFERKLNGSGQISLGRRLYSVGQAQVRTHQLTSVQIHFDARRREWVCQTPSQIELKRMPPVELDLFSLTGLDPAKMNTGEPVQLTLPFLIQRRGTN